MNVFTYPLVSGESAFILIVVLAIAIVILAVDLLRGSSLWRRHVSPEALVAFGAVMGAYLVYAEIGDARKHYCAVHMHCIRREGIVETHIHHGAIPSVDVVIGGHTFTMFRGSFETTRILTALASGDASRQYVFCSDRSGTVLRVDRVRRRGRRNRR